MLGPLTNENAKQYFELNDYRAMAGLKPELEKCNSDGYCEIPGGTFKMGSVAGDDSERPVRTIAMTGFLLERTEKRLGVVESYINKRTHLALLDIPENMQGDNFPALCLPVDLMRDICKSEGGDLATAAQLHFASRYDDYAANAVIHDNGLRTTVPVTGGYKNRFGIYNLRGNGWETSLDAYYSRFYYIMRSQDPYMPITDKTTQYVELSGGFYNSALKYSRAASRDSLVHVDRCNHNAFRCARPFPQDK